MLTLKHDPRRRSSREAEFDGGGAGVQGDRPQQLARPSVGGVVADDVDRAARQGDGRGVVDAVEVVGAAVVERQRAAGTGGGWGGVAGGRGGQGEACRRGAGGELGDGPANQVCAVESHGRHADAGQGALERDRDPGAPSCWRPH